MSSFIGARAGARNDTAYLDQVAAIRSCPRFRVLQHGAELIQRNSMQQIQQPGNSTNFSCLLQLGTELGAVESGLNINSRLETATSDGDHHGARSDGPPEPT